ncbi:DUF5872 domain-containing protein [Methylobacterium sp. Leaf118]|uniref:DUF5872 domain-containing protein n=1 Tax=Methylobacterium sp. Leaf118 TaxID=2876562 RepID=UPI001E45CA1A|nr:DUF5872 domain-containing protein [Methylobacterium sp. Leaf118]
MAERAKKTDPKLWEKVKDEVTNSSKGGKPGQWSARKAQMATTEYKKEGGRYEGRKSDDNSLKQWTDEQWGTKSGEASGKTGERYLPEKARETLTASEYRRSTAKKRADSAQGKQHSKQPADVAKKAASARKTGKTANASGGDTKAELMERARKRDIAGRSKMTKGELERALGA